MDQHRDHHPPPHTFPSSWSSDNFVPHPVDNHNGGFHHRPHQPHKHHHFPNHQHHHNFSSEQNENDSAVSTTNFPLSGHKRQFPHSSRASAGRQECKLYVGGLNKLASNLEVAEIFSPYGCVLDVFQLRDELKQNRGLAFIQFAQREMALAAIAALNGKYVMKGCVLPLIVRFAEPKKPKSGESRPGPYSREVMGQPMLPNGSNMYSQTGGGTSTTSSNSPAVSSFSEMEDLPDCDWSEHICPDGNEYYYNCVTCESKWEKPEEYKFYEQHIQNGQQLHPPSQNLQSRSDPQVLITHHAPQIQQVQLQT